MQPDPSAIMLIFMPTCMGTLTFRSRTWSGRAWQGASSGDVKESPGELRTTDLIRLGATTWRRGEEEKNIKNAHDKQIQTDYKQ